MTPVQWDSLRRCADGGEFDVPPVAFAFLSNWIGILGAFMTSSNTASNILFAPLQEIVSEAEQAFSEATIIAAQSTGGAIGNAIVLERA